MGVHKAYQLSKNSSQGTMRACRRDRGINVAQRSNVINK